MPNPFIGEIRMFAGNFAPRSWALCDGQLLTVSSNAALFSLLGTFYGGDGMTTFGLPDLRGRVPIHQGSGPGLTPRPLGQRSGQEQVALNPNQIPSHTHQQRANAGDGNAFTPQDKAPAKSKAGLPQYASTVNATMDAGAITNTGTGQSHTNVMPFLAIHFIIALAGTFPDDD